MNTALPIMTKAAVVHEFGKPIDIEEVEGPARLEPGSLLVEIIACSVCGTDVHCWEGQLDLKIDLPLILGHEMVGRIIGFGDGPRADSVGQTLAEGDRVIWTHGFCGHCQMCAVKMPALCLNRIAYGHVSMNEPPYLMGGFAEHAYVLPTAGRVRVPDAVPDALASMASCAMRSVVNAVQQAGQIAPTETVVVQGAGPLGILATGLFSLAGAKQVITIGAPDARLQLARDFGADQTISIDALPDPDERRSLILEATEGLGADLVAEFSGHPAAFAEGVDLARPGGRYVVVGQLGKATTTVAPSLINKKNLTVQGSFGGDVGHYHKALLILEQYADRLPFDRLISGEYALNDVGMVLSRMQSLQEIKPVIYPASSSTRDVSDR